MENTALEELKAHLMASDEEFRHLAELHAQYKRRVETLEAKHASSVQDQLEEQELKKKKLRLKDQMTEMINRSQAVA